MRASEQRQALYQRQKQQEQERLERPWHQDQRARLLSTLQRIKDSEAVEASLKAMPESASQVSHQGDQQRLSIKLKIGEHFFRFQASSLREIEDFGAALWPCCCVSLVPCS